MNDSTKQLGASPVRDPGELPFEPRGAPIAGKVLAAALTAVILVAALV